MTGRRAAYLCAAAFVSILARSASAGQNTWTTNGPYGGYVGSILVDPKLKSTIYVAATYGVFKSTDGGSTWRLTGSALANMWVRALVLDPSDPQILYAGTDEGVFKSADGGLNWVNKSAGLANLPVLALIVDPRNPGTVFAGTTASQPGGSLFKTNDGGEKWRAANQGLPPNVQTWSLALDPSDSSMLYAVVGAEIFRTTNAGLSWTRSLGGLPTDQGVLSVAVDVTNNATVYAGAVGGVHRSHDHGITWLPPSEPVPIAKNLLSTKGGLLAADTRGVYKSTDGAATWTLLVSGLPTPPLVNVLAEGFVPGTLYSGTRRGFFQWTDAGKAWVERNHGITGVIARSLGPRPVGPTLYTGTSHGVYRSADTGHSWEPRNSGLFFAADVLSLGVDANAPESVYAGTFGCCGVYKSSDGGAQWRNVLSSGAVSAIAVDPKQPSRGWVADVFNGVWRTTDAGETWQRINVGISVQTELPVDLVVDPKRTDTLYLAVVNSFEQSGEVYKSQNGGDRWFPTGLNRYVHFLTIDPADAKTVYVGTRDGLFRSRNGGQIWKSIASPPGLPVSLAVDPVKSSTLYVAAGRDEVFRSTDEGQTWTQFGSGFDSAEVYRVATDPTGKFLFAATSRGVFEYEFSITSFYTLAPCRVIDTRESASPLIAEGHRTVAVAGKCGVPATARSVALNVTVTEPTNAGHLALSDVSVVRDTIAIAYSSGQTRANNAVVGLDPFGRLTVKCNQPSGSVHVILDVSGYFQ